MAHTRGFSNSDLPLYTAAEWPSVVQKSCSNQCVQEPNSELQGLAHVPGSLLEAVPELPAGLPWPLKEVVPSQEQIGPARLIVRDDSVTHITEAGASEDILEEPPATMNQQQSPLERPVRHERITRKVGGEYVIICVRETPRLITITSSSPQNLQMAICISFEFIKQLLHVSLVIVRCRSHEAPEKAYDEKSGGKE